MNGATDFNQLFHDGKAKAGSSKFSTDLGIGLFEIFKYGIQFILSPDANSGVVYPQIGSGIFQLT